MARMVTLLGGGSADPALLARIVVALAAGVALFPIASAAGLLAAWSFGGIAVTWLFILRR